MASWSAWYSEYNNFIYIISMIYRPIKPFVINQYFGENKACIPTKGGPVITCNGLNPPYGYKSLYGPKGHLGLDLRAYHGQEVYCALEGEVYRVDTSKRSGLDVRIISNMNGRKIRCIYEHLLGYQPQVGDVIPTGALIGWANNTGYSSGNHLHFQVEELKSGKWIPIDPLSIMDKVFAPDLQPILARMSETLAKMFDTLADIIRSRKNK